MPIYEYSCGKCRAEFEQLVRSEVEERQLRCPECGGKRLERKLSVFAAHEGAAKSAPPGPCGRCGEADGMCPYN